MKKERDELLKELYNHAISLNHLYTPLRLSVEELTEYQFNVEMLEGLGFVKFDTKSRDLTLTVQGALEAELLIEQ